jgi:signal transduction histidine kinase
MSAGEGAMSANASRTGDTPGLAHDAEMLRACERYEQHCALGILAAAAAHEVGSPLNAILLNAQLARSRAAGGAGALLDAVGKVIEQVGEATTASRKLMEFAGQPAHDPQPQDVSRLVKEACGLAAPVLEQGRGARLDLALAELPRMLLDAVAMRTAIFILLRDAAARGHAGMIVRAQAIREQDHVVLSIEDDGAALPEALLRRVFNPLRASERATASQVLGAAVVNQIVTRHGGTLAVSSRSQDGTRFELRLAAP